MPASVAFSSDVGATEVLFGGEGVVGSAAKRQIFELVPAALSERVQMVDFEAVRFATPLSAVIDVRASAAVAFENGSALGCRNVSAALATLARVLGDASAGSLLEARRLGLRRARWSSGFGADREPLFLEGCHQEAHGLKMELAEVLTRCLP